jgi:cytochrome c peroxidase
MTIRFRLVFALLASGACGACRDAPTSSPRYPSAPPAGFLAGYTSRIDSIDQALADLAALPARPDSATAQQAFRRARALYKRLEYLIEFDNWYRAQELNSPPIPLPDEDDPRVVIPPRGFQVVEAVIFPRPTRDFAPVTRRNTGEMRKVLGFIRRDSTERAWTWVTPFRAARMEVARVVTLGIAGFDATLSGDAMVEGAEALRGVGEGLDVYRDAMIARDSAGWLELRRSIDAAIAALEASPGFDEFDRFGFVVRYANPVAAGLARLQRALALPEPTEVLDVTEPHPWNPGATNIYAAGAINPRWFAPDYAPPPTPELVALGRKLFFDPALSAGGHRSCATCHQPAAGFTDGRRVALVDPGHGHVRNTPTLLNAGLQRRQFADQRVGFLEFQFEDVMSNPREMALVPDSAARKLSGDTALVARFAAALGKPATQALTGQSLSIAVAAYVRSLEALDSRFDRAIRGDTGAVSTSERRGFNLFMGKAACGTCHFAPLFGGTTPPNYLDSEPEVIGVPSRPVKRGAVIDDDVGVFTATRAALHRHAFKTPTVRNVALTAPYMHNGVYRTLEELIDFYDRGGGAGIGIRLPNQTLPPDRLRLSEEEKGDLKAFMESLTDSTYRAESGGS